MKIIKAIISLAFIIWIGGAAYLSVQIEAERKRDCIDEQGIIAGMLWCEGENAVESQFTQNAILSLNWPLKIFKPAIVYKSAEFNDPENHQRELFLCNYAAFKLGLTDDDDDHAKLILAMAGKLPDYKILETWNADVKLWAAENDVGSGIAIFYKNNCVERFSIIINKMGG